MNAVPKPPTPLRCLFCPHPAHPGKHCPVCDCKGKKRWFDTLLDAIGNAIGQAKFGGD